ncbi:AAA family ATPase [Nocardioides sp. 31GB23]|uniref:ATP-dependent nuclease n=1 Tax=Nocardioides sp. 31GB23 TaxID=3156065 RepID=UPI0032AFAD6C
MSIGLETFANHDESLLGGRAQDAGLSISYVDVDGQPVGLPTPGVTAFVGGNNVGKSTLLRQLVSWIGSEPGSPLGGPTLLRAAALRKQGDPASLVAWLYRHRVATTQGGNAGFLHFTAGFLDTQSAAHYWRSEAHAHRLSRLGAALVFYAGTQQRLEMSQPSARRGDFTEVPSTPLQQLEDSPELFAELSRIAQDTFAEGMVLDTLSNELMLRIGTPAVAAPPVDAITAEYREALGRLLPLHEQGDGMRSMIGLLLPIVASTYPVVVVDEPEAFLHPPQARILGRELAVLSESRKIQIVLATHDRNILAGLLDVPTASVSVVRLTRQGERTTASQIPADELRTVWSNPSLRYTNILDGVFHRAVVLAENERDCQFFAAALEDLHREGPLELSPNDILFVPTAGKTNMKALARTMRACGVPTVASVDLDLLNDERTASSLVEALDGEWSTVANDYRITTAQFRLPKTKRQNRDVLGAISAVLDTAPEATYVSDTKRRVQEAMSVDSPWQSVKDYGVSAFRNERQRADSLIANLDAMGVVLVKEGELEGFARALGVAKGAGWVPSALAAGAHRESPAREHVSRLVSAALNQERAVLSEASPVNPSNADSGGTE